ncbi:16S rRNA (cytidine(1402)-2'-O)-methyltransferase [candidate division WOR-3 bacterium]|nr:16S rRNA (cytidine(1402)-2'-O)-methyltransferase [candidate division WOR-3 bacterium]
MSMSPRDGQGEPAAGRPDPGLYVVSTPIGNLRDMTRRAAEVLAGADVVACEDTRRTGLLLHRLGIRGRLVSYHEYNKLRRTPELLELLRQGKAVALVSEAGTPGVSDPGYYLIRTAIEQRFRVIPVPGASALLAAITVSGMPSDRFAFEGFLPRRAGRRKTRLAAVADETRTMVFFESPVRLVRLLVEMRELWGERQVVVCRELTKKFEETLRGTIGEVLEALGTGPVRGEVTVVVAGRERDD